MKPDAATRLARLQALKGDTLEQARALRLPIEADGAVIGSLVPIGPWILTDPHHIDLICQWRQAAMTMFMAQFDSTPERTHHYLQQRSVGEADRILFFIHDADDRCVGHGGFSGIGENSAELDNLMRGVGGGHPALIQHAERTLLAWLFAQMGSAEITARVLSYSHRIARAPGFQAARQHAAQKDRLRRRPDAAGALRARAGQCAAHLHRAGPEPDRLRRSHCTLSLRKTDQGSGC